MAIPEQVIENAVTRYEREQDRYLKLAVLVADLCRTNIVDRDAIRAQVTFRAKTPKSFAGKLRRFAKDPNKSFSTVEEIFNGVGDFAGVRIATYQPEDEKQVVERVAQLFDGPNNSMVEIDRKDKLKQSTHQFYRATHCQVCLREEDLVGPYENLRGTGCEIQVCSMMAHVWNEIEHDIGYKPSGGSPHEGERGLLESLGHLTRSGDAIITRLLAANLERMAQGTGEFADVHEFVARLQPFFPEADLTVNAGQAFALAQMLDLNSVPALQARLGAGAFEPDQVRNMIEMFNTWLVGQDSSEFVMNPASADLISISLLAASSELEQGEGRTSAYGGAGRLSYLSRLIRQFGAQAPDAAVRDS